VEHAFGVSGLHSSHDNRRVANYGVSLRGFDAGQPWLATLSFVERFTPPGEQRVRRFRSTPRAELIDPHYRGAIEIRFSLQLPRESVPGTAACFDIAAFHNLVGRLGWTTRTEPVMVFDAPGYDQLRMQRGRMTARTPLRPEGGCLRDFLLTREADPGAT
jgi:hypothetical protein